MKLLIILCWSLFVFHLSVVFAAGEGLPTQEDMQKAQQMTNELFQSTRMQNSLSKIMKQANTVTPEMMKNITPGQAGVGTPNFDAASLPSNIDLEKLAERAEKMKHPENMKKQMPDLLIFVSLSMPKESLKRYVDSAAKSGAAMVIRGMVGENLNTTRAAIQKLVGTKQRNMGILIDPLLFKKFNINKVPAIVLVDNGDTNSLACRSSTGDCSSVVPPYTLVYGDVSLRYALDTMARLDPNATEMSQKFIRRLRK